MAGHCAQLVQDRHEQVNDNRAAMASPHGRKLAARWDDMSGRPLGRGDGVTPRRDIRTPQGGFRRRALP